MAKNANEEQKAEFVKVIEDTLKAIVENGMDKKALEAGINYHEFRYREADFGGYPKGLMYGLRYLTAGFMMRQSRLSMWRHWTPLRS